MTSAELHVQGSQVVFAHSTVAFLACLTESLTLRGGGWHSGSLFRAVVCFSGRQEHAGRLRRLVVSPWQSGH